VDPRATLRHIFDAAVASADPGAAVLRHLPEKPRGCCVVIGAGKASVAMAAALDAAWLDVDLTGVVVTRRGQGGSASLCRRSHHHDCALRKRISTKQSARL
jgi:glycerate 2-kinase